jgi:hypothetical protein
VWPPGTWEYSQQSHPDWAAQEVPFVAHNAPISVRPAQVRPDLWPEKDMAEARLGDDLDRVVAELPLFLLAALDWGRAHCDVERALEFLTRPFDIQTHRYAPRHEAELALRYSVSRVTVRRALEDLRDEGLVTAKCGSGWYVVSGASFGQSLALGSFQHAQSAVTEAGVPLARKVTGYEYTAAPIDVSRLLQIAQQSETLRVSTARYAGKHPLKVIVE